MKVPVYYPLDADQEATGTVHWFCSEHCREKTTFVDYDAVFYAKGEDSNYAPGTVCEGCGAILPETQNFQLVLEDDQILLKKEGIDGSVGLNSLGTYTWNLHNKGQRATAFGCHPNKWIALGELVEAIQNA